MILYLTYGRLTKAHLLQNAIYDPSHSANFKAAASSFFFVSYSYEENLLSS